MGKKALSPEFREYLAEIGRKGGKKGGTTRAARMTPRERSASARKAVLARWAKRKAKTAKSLEG
jgi:general stress protein YciG